MGRLLLFRLLILALALRAVPVMAERFQTAAYDHIPWSFTTEQPVVAIGDVHGDLSALATILEKRALVDRQGNWSGGETHLVLMGDLIDRGPHGKLIMDWILQLETQARSQGGQIHALLGNHELMVIKGDVRYTTAAEHRSFAEWSTLPETVHLARELNLTPENAAIVSAVRYSEPYRRWFGRRNSIIKINRTLFVHGGLDDWGSNISLGAINSSIRRLIHRLQQRSHGSTEFDWTIDSSGPLWTREMAEGRMVKSDIDRLIKRFDVDQIVIGHTPTADGRIERVYDGKVIKIDTGISTYYGGQLGSLTIKETNATRAMHISRSSKPHHLVSHLMQSLYSPCSQLGRMKN